MVAIVQYQPVHFDRVAALWEETFPNDPPWNRAGVAIPAKMAIQPDLLLLAIDGDDVLGAVMAGYDGHRGWLYSVAVRRSHRRSGVGTALVHGAEEALKSLGCLKINLQVRSTNEAVVRFYERLGYLVEERISMGKRC